MIHSHFWRCTCCLSCWAGRLSMDSSEGDIEVSLICLIWVLFVSEANVPIHLPNRFPSSISLFRHVRVPSLPPPPSSGIPCSAGRDPTRTPQTRWDAHLFFRSSFGVEPWVWPSCVSSGRKDADHWSRRRRRGGRWLYDQWGERVSTSVLSAYFTVYSRVS